MTWLWVGALFPPPSASFSRGSLARGRGGALEGEGEREAPTLIAIFAASKAFIMSWEGGAG